MSSNRDEVTRRAFLARIGVLGASAVLLPRCTPGPAPAGGAPTGEVASEISLGALVESLRPVLSALARDTLNAFVAFNLPGQDPYSQAQGTPRAEPGGIEAQGTDFLIENLDRFLPFPDALVQPAAAGLVTALADLPLPLSQPLPLPLPLPLPGGVVTLGLVDDAVRYILQNDEAMPISLPVALLFNYLATAVSPAALSGPFLSPFARLSFAQKARAMELLETSHPQLVAVVDAQLPQPLKASASGLLKFIGGALQEFAALGSMGESRKYNPQTRTLTGRPVGWQLTGYLPDNQTGDGWDDLLGYYQNRREATDA